MRPLAVALAFALLAAACSASLPPVPSAGENAFAGTYADRHAYAAELAPSQAGNHDAAGAPANEDRGPVGEDGSEADDGDGDDGELLGMVRAGPSLAPLHGSDVRWAPWADRILLDLHSSDLNRPPIRA